MPELKLDNVVPVRGRPRRLPDDKIIQAALDIVLASGPVNLTFARLADRVSMVPASLVHRFGTRDRLFAEISQAVTRRYEGLSDAATAGAGSVASVIEFLVALARADATPASVINQVSMMQIELATPTLSDDVARRSEAVRSAILAMLQAAIDLGELTDVDADRLAAALHDTQVGALLNWCVNPDGELRHRIERDVRFVLEPFLIAPIEQHWLFSYGTLRQPEVQQALFGRELTAIDDVLPGFRIGQLPIADQMVAKLSGSSTHPVLRPGEYADEVRGAALAVTITDLLKADAYEVADYVRINVTLASGRRAYAYAHRDDV